MQHKLGTNPLQIPKGKLVPNEVDIQDMLEAKLLSKINLYGRDPLSQYHKGRLHVYQQMYRLFENCEGYDRYLAGY